jgi:hypothetical protein
MFIRQIRDFIYTSKDYLMKNINPLMKDFSKPIQASIDSFMQELSSAYLYNRSAPVSSQPQTLINFGLIPVS